MPCQRSTPNDEDSAGCERLSGLGLLVSLGDDHPDRGGVLLREGRRSSQRLRALAAAGAAVLGGVNIYDKMIFPNPPIMPITLYPLMVLPTVAGAMCWFAIKVALTTAVLIMLFRDRAARRAARFRRCSGR